MKPVYIGWAILLAVLAGSVSGNAQSIVGQKRKFDYPATLAVCTIDGSVSTALPPVVVSPDMYFSILASEAFPKNRTVKF